MKSKEEVLHQIVEIVKSYSHLKMINYHSLNLYTLYAMLINGKPTYFTFDKFLIATLTSSNEYGLESLS